MVLHTFALRFKPETTQPEKDRIHTAILAFRGQVPGLVEIHAGSNFSAHPSAFDYGAVMHFANRGALADYLPSPLHQQFLAWAVPLIAQAQDVDFEV